MNKLIEGNNLTKHYDGFTLDRVSIDIPAGYVVGLIGSNGAGKTTAIKALLGLIKLDGGEVRAFGEAPTGSGWKSRIGVVFDTCAFVPTMTAADIAGIGKAAYADWDDNEFARLLDMFALPARKQVKDLSRGMTMKLSLAFALAHHPDLLILDEPTAGLDPIARDEALEYLRAFMDNERHGILISSHITTDLEKIAKDDICNKAGIAHCNEEQLSRIRASAIDGSAPHYLRRDFQIDVLVPDRFAFTRAFPEVPCDPASIDDYMLLMLKGGAR